MLIDNIEVDAVPFCLCHVVYKTPKTYPRLLYKRSSNLYQLYCPKCGFKTYQDTNKQAVISDWFYSNRFGDAHIKSCWIIRHNKQNGTTESHC